VVTQGSFLLKFNSQSFHAGGLIRHVPKNSHFSLAHRWTVLLGVLVLIAAGCWVVYTIPVDAFPDLTNNQVVIVTSAVDASTEVSSLSPILLSAR
jgi:multidrug efflux pump subunit AcrB